MPAGDKLLFQDDMVAPSRDEHKELKSFTNTTSLQKLLEITINGKRGNI